MGKRGITKTVGIFDSGLGGISVLKYGLVMMPEVHFYYYGDSLHAPYGEKSKEFIQKRSLEIGDEMEQREVQALVVACNTATSAAIGQLRLRYPYPVIGMEPAIKPALHAYPNSRVHVMATPFTLKEQKFQELVVHLGNDRNIHPIPCPGLVTLIEEQGPNHEMTREYLTHLFGQYRISEGDIIVLGCTHYVFLRPLMKEILPKGCVMIDGNEGTMKQLMRKLGVGDRIETRQVSSKSFSISSEVKDRVEFYNSRHRQIEKSWKLLLEEQ